MTTLVGAERAAATVYDRLGVRTFINATGHNTAQGGSLMPPDVLEAMHQGAQRHVELRELQDAAGRRIAEVIGMPAALVSSGAAGGILLAAAATLTDMDRDKVYALPETPPNGKNQIVVWRAPRPNYMHQACQAAGAILVEVGEPDGPVSPEHFRNAFGPRTAAVLLVLARIDQARERTGGWESFIGGVCRYANQAGVPVLVDAAAELPPRSLPRRLLDVGASTAIFSGGKAIRGPQCSGLVLGRPELIAAAALNNNPNSAVGRPMKVGKEEICGLVAAVERFFGLDEQAQRAEWEDWTRLMAAAVAGQPSVRAEVIADHPDYGRPPFAPKAVLRFDGAATAAQALAAELANGEPSIHALRHGDHLILNPMALEPGDAELIAGRLRTVLG